MTLTRSATHARPPLWGFWHLGGPKCLYTYDLVMNVVDADALLDLPTGGHLLCFEWHTFAATQTEVILPNDKTFTQLAQAFLGPAGASTGAEPGPGPQWGHCQAEVAQSTQMLCATNITHKDSKVPSTIHTVGTPSVVLGGPSRLETYMTDLGMHLVDSDALFDSHLAFFGDVFKRWHHWAARKRLTRGGPPRRPLPTSAPEPLTAGPAFPLSLGPSSPPAASLSASSLLLPPSFPADAGGVPRSRRSQKKA